MTNIKLDHSNLPALPSAVKDAKASREQIFTLRHMHLGDPEAGKLLEIPGTDVLPALLNPYRDSSRLRYDYPLILFPTANGDGYRPAIELAKPLSEWMRQAAAVAAPGDSAKILKDHLPWLEHHIRKALAQQDGPVDAIAPLQTAGVALQEHLNLSANEKTSLDKDLQDLYKQLPPGTALLAYGRYAALHLLVHAVQSRVLPRRQRLVTLITNCIKGLQELLRVEWSKSTEAIEPAQARDSVGPGASLFNIAALSEVMDYSRGTYVMPAERRLRIDTVLKTLENWELDDKLVYFVHAGALSCDWLKNDPNLDEYVDPAPCARAMDVFDQKAANLARLFAAVRIAQLEINGIYDSAIHNPWFANFNWEGFNRDELLQVPSVVAIESADRMAQEGLRQFSQLLSSGRPVQILIRVQSSNNPGVAIGADPFQSYRTELGYLGIAHRQALVAQTSSARHQHLLESVIATLDATRTGLHLINTGLRPGTQLVPLNAWLVAGAALEGRAHPFFRVNPQAGDSAAKRFDFSGNPQPEKDWPLSTFDYIDENGQTQALELAFTFADYALLVDNLRNHFRLIQSGCEADALILLQDYLAMRPEEAHQRIPYIFGIDARGVLHRLVVSRSLAVACLDRLNFWHSLQELAGVRNLYVEQAIEQTRTVERAQATAERERLLAEHAALVERVRTQAATEAMQRLADLLLNIDAAVPVHAATGVVALKTEAALTPAVATTATAAVVAAPAVTEASFDESWLDTPLCTSCNDCFKVNPLLFIYNSDKQAQLGDLSKGTYAQLVKAAELCPAHCIHPGKPWNPDKPGLEALIAKAKKLG